MSTGTAFAMSQTAAPIAKPAAAVGRAPGASVHGRHSGTPVAIAAPDIHAGTSRRSWTTPLCGVGAAFAVCCSRHHKAQGKQARVVKMLQTSGGTALSETSQVLSDFRFSAEMSTLSRWLSYDAAFDPEFLSMEPKEGSQSLKDMVTELGLDFNAGDPISALNQLKGRGSISGVSFQTRTTGTGKSAESVCLAAVNVASCVVCGVGSDKDKKRARHLASAQALERLQAQSGIAREFIRAAQADDAALPAAQVLEHLGSHFDQSCAIVVAQPCGSSWKATVTGKFNGVLLLGSGRGGYPTREAAIVAAGLELVQEVKGILRIPKDAPHMPSEWADNLNYQQSNETVDLPTLGPDGSEDLLRELLGSEEDEQARAEALQEAIARQDKRIAALEELSLRKDEDQGEDVGRVVARRVWEVTKPEDEDWRREEVKGTLPAEQVREELAKALEYGQSVIISGGTGSGKSTQLPQFILDDFRDWEVEEPEAMKNQPLELEVGGVVEVEFEEEWYRCEILEVADDKKTITAKYFDGGDEEGDIDVADRVRKEKPRWTNMKPKIVVTQPRRIAATSLAQRVSWERFADECGGEIGYAVRGDTVMPDCETGTIEFCTVGTLLRRLVSDPLLSRYNVVILDEVHERDLMTDFLLILMREVMPKRPDLRLVLMSATLDVQTFKNYLKGAKVIEVPVGTRYPVEEIHLEDEFFEGFRQTQALLSSEENFRQDVGGSGEGVHDFSVSDVEEKALVEQVRGMIAKDKAAKKAWNSFCKETGAEKDPASHPHQALTSFVSRMEGDDDDDDAEEGGISSAVLAEQINQLAGFSDETRQALAEFREGKGEFLEQWDPEDLQEFLSAQGVRPWKADRASWELTLSASWWGSDKNDSQFVDLVEETIKKVAPDMLEVEEDDEIGVGSILVFLPGWAEIRKLAEKLEKTGPSNLWVLKLHSQVEREEQAQIFDQAEEGMVKVILATNMAESSVTINDVRCVIDAGLHREMSYDPKRRMSALDTVWICQSNAVQRKGRAGRVRSGRVFRLYTRDQFQSVPWRPAPEMQRCNLAQTCLQCISLGQDPREFLAKAPDPPSVGAVEAAMSELECLDAIRDGVPPRMMPVGQILSRLPMDPLLGRAMMLGALFGVPQMTAALLVTAASRSPFVATPDRRDEVLSIRKDFCQWSDVIGYLRALMEFEEVYKERGHVAGEQWARKRSLNFGRMLNMSRQKFQLLRDVERSGILGAAATEGMNPEEWGWDEDGEDGWEQSEGAEAFRESAGALMEAEDGNMQMRHSDWKEQLKGTHAEVEDERLLVGILCAAYPSNIARRHKFNHARVQAGMSQAMMGMRSVNFPQKDALNDMNLPEPSWWLYSDMRMFSGQLQLSETTLLSPWHVALFAGLRARERPDLTLDGWLSMDSHSSGADLVRPLRQEIRQALVWVAIAASWDSVAQAAVSRSKALLRTLGNAILQREQDEEDLELIRSWELPKLQEGDSALGASEEQREELEEQLMKKTVAELKVLLREMGAKVSGRKMDLVSRCADFLIYGEEEEWGDHEGEGEDDS